LALPHVVVLANQAKPCWSPFRTWRAAFLLKMSIKVIIPSRRQEGKAEMQIVSLALVQAGPVWLLRSDPSASNTDPVPIMFKFERGYLEGRRKKERAERFSRRCNCVRFTSAAQRLFFCSAEVPQIGRPSEVDLHGRRCQR
jgi:hypothetical protein